MKKILMATICIACLSFVSSAMASPIYYQANNVSGNGTITYGTGAPTFSFTNANPGSTVGWDFSAFSPGEYTLSVSLSGFWADFNEDDIVDFTLPGGTLTSNPFTLAALPSSSGTAGQLAWDVDLSLMNPSTISYDFGNSGFFTNAGVNSLLYSLDPDYNGMMDADMGWNTLRVELNSTAAPVPEPATMLLFGTGLLGLVGYNRKRLAKKS